MRYLILTDIHANIDALDALDEPYDLLLALGDLVDYGAAPSQAVHYEYLSGDADEEVWRAAVGDLADREEWLFVGHTHRPFVRRVGRLTVVNPGSLGMAVDGDPRACYAVWEDG